MDVDCILLELVQHGITTIFVLVRLQARLTLANTWASRNRRLCSQLRRTICREFSRANLPAFQREFDRVAVSGFSEFET